MDDRQLKLLTEPDEASVRGTRESARRSRLGTWILIGVPLVGVGEAVAHWVQSRDVMAEMDWAAGRAAVDSMLKPEDAVLVSPSWAFPLARKGLGDEVFTLERAAWADLTRYPEALHVSVDGSELPELRGWVLREEREIGGLRLIKRSNPNHRPVLDNLLSHVGDGLAVEHQRGHQTTPCRYRIGEPVAGSLGTGPAMPRERFECGSVWVGLTVISDEAYRPRYCLFMPAEGGAILRIRFADIRFGASLEGHHGLTWEAERDRKGAPMEISFQTDTRTVGVASHNDGQGWSSFAFETGELAGQTGPLTVQVSSSGHNRVYCFEATTR